MRIVIDFIPQEAQRYDTLGDWTWDDDETLRISTSEDDGEDAAFLVALHELTEAWLCRKAGITQEDVDAFDLTFVAPDDDPDAEPGDDPASPYREQHRKAMLIEHLLAIFLGVSDYGMIR